jgi:hypothetical protein
MNLDPVPGNLVAVRNSLHQLAFFAISPARYRMTGRMGLMATDGGFGTPEFDGRVLRVEGNLLVSEHDGNIATRTIGTVRDASEFFGFEYETDWFADFHDPLVPTDPDRELEVDAETSRFIGDWFVYGFDLLNRFRETGVPEDDVSETQLWPEHFDPATESGDHDKGQRASFGASPGDTDHPEPYLYVSSWSEIDRSNPYWNESSFNGASLGYAQLLTADDPIERGLAFLIEGYRVLHGD